MCATYWSWRAIFLVNVPLGVVVFVLALALIPASPALASRRVDGVGIVLLLATLLPAMFAISLLGEGSGWSAWLLALVIAVAAGAFFARHSVRDPDAVIPIRYLRGNGLGIVHIVNIASGAASVGFGALIPLYAHDRYQLPALRAGTLLTARAIGMIALSSITVFLLRRTGCRKPMAAGFTVIAVGLALTALRTPAGLTSYAWLSITSAVTGIGMGPSIPASNNAVLHLVPGSAAAMSGLRGMFRQAGGIIGVSVIAALTANNAHPGQVHAASFIAPAALLLLVPVITHVPDHRGGW